MPEEARDAVLEALPLVGTLLALRNRLSTPACVEEALSAPLASVWGDSLPVLKGYVDDPSSALEGPLGELSKHAAVLPS
jgi:hypothetical protein